MMTGKPNGRWYQRTNRVGHMRRRSRLRRFLKWVGLMTSVLIAVLFVLSLRWTLTMYRSGHGYVLGYGCLAAQSTSPSMGTPQSGWRFRTSRDPGAPLVRSWRLRVTRPISGVWSVVVPLWMPLFVAAIATAFLWRRDRRPPPGHCQNCGYDLTGNITGLCPECGIAQSKAGQ